MKHVYSSKRTAAVAVLVAGILLLATGAFFGGEASAQGGGSISLSQRADLTKASGIWSDSETMWVADHRDGIIYAYDLESREYLPGRNIDVNAHGDFAPHTSIPRAWPTGITGYTDSNGAPMLAVLDLWSNELRVYSRASGAFEFGFELQPGAGGYGNAMGVFVPTILGGFFVTDRDGGAKMFHYTAAGVRTPANDRDLDPRNDDPTFIWTDRNNFLYISDANDKLFAYQLIHAGSFNIRDVDRNTAGVQANALIYLDGHSTAGIWGESTRSDTTAEIMHVADHGRDEIVAYEVKAFYPTGTVRTDLRREELDFGTLKKRSNPDPRGIHYDGGTGEFWVADASSDALIAFSAVSNQFVPSRNIWLAPANDDPTGIWADDTTMWVADENQSKVFAYALSDGSRDIAEEFDYPGIPLCKPTVGVDLGGPAVGECPAGTTDLVYPSPSGMWGATFDVEEHLHLLDPGQDRIIRYDREDWAVPWTGELYNQRVSLASGMQIPTTQNDFADPNDVPWGLWSNGAYTFVGDIVDGYIYAYHDLYKYRVPSVEIDLGGIRPLGITSDGESMFVVSGADDAIYQYPMRSGADRNTELRRIAMYDTDFSLGFLLFGPDVPEHDCCRSPSNQGGWRIALRSAGTDKTMEWNIDALDFYLADLGATVTSVSGAGLTKTSDPDFGDTYTFSITTTSATLPATETYQLSVVITAADGFTRGTSVITFEHTFGYDQGGQSAEGDAPAEELDDEQPVTEAPAAPTGLSGSASADGETVTLTWTDPDDESIISYTVYRREGDGELEGVATTGSSETSHTDPGVEPGKSYGYVITAINAIGEGERSGEFAIVTPGGEPEVTDPPAQPSRPTASATSEAVTLTWSDPGDETISGYKILRRSVDGATYGDGRGAAEFVEVGSSGPATSYVDSSVSARTKYVYRIVAVNAAGDSERSRYRNVETLAAPRQSELTAEFRAAPERHDGSSAFTVELHLSEEVDIGWRDIRDSVLTVSGGTVTGARRLSAGSNMGWEVTLAPGSDAAVDIVLTPKGSCDAAGALCTADGRGLATGLSVTVSGPDAPPSQPSRPTATATSEAVTLTWADPGDESITDYKILRRNVDGATYGDGQGAAEFVEVGSSGPATSYVDSSVAARTKYVYRVVAVNAAGDSERSRYVNVETP